jgi:UDP-glucuronate 4-epimerase
MNFYMKVLVAGSADFLGSALSIRLFERGDRVFGIDNHNDYYALPIKKRV